MKNKTRKKKWTVVDPDAFLEAMVNWQERGKPFSGQDELCLFYYPMSVELVASKGRGHIDPDDLVQECVLSCCRKAKYYSSDRGSCFNFFTKVIINKIFTVYAQENNKRKPGSHVSIDDEFIESVVSLAVNRFEENRFDDCIKRKVLTPEEVREEMLRCSNTKSIQ